MSVAIVVAFACAVCGAAEKTLPANGSEIAFEGRKRATLDLRAASFETRDRSLQVVELRAQPGVAMTFGASTLFAVEVPLLRRTLSLDASAAPRPVVGTPAGPAPGSSGSPGSRSTGGVTNGATLDTTAMMLGDVELRAAHTPWRSEPGTFTRRFTITAGTKLPTAPLERDPGGALVHPDLQPGCGSVVPFGWWWGRPRAADVCGAGERRAEAVRRQLRELSGRGR